MIKSKEYRDNSKISPIQFVMKIGSGIHRGLGVQILDQKLERIYLEDYQNGKKCGQLNNNEIA